MESLFVPLTFVRRSTCASHVCPTPTRPICGHAALSLSLSPPPSFCFETNNDDRWWCAKVQRFRFLTWTFYLSRHFECLPPIWISLLTQRESIVDSWAHCRRRGYFLFSETTAPPCRRRKRHEYGHGKKNIRLDFPLRAVVSPSSAMVPRLACLNTWPNSAPSPELLAPRILKSENSGPNKTYPLFSTPDSGGFLFANLDF